MTTSLFFVPAAFEPIYGWFEAHAGVTSQVWGLESGARAALLAYSDGGDDAFGWANWAAKAYEDPSELSALFDMLELVLDEAPAAELQGAFPGAFTTPPR